MPDHPYRSLPDDAYWRRGVADAGPLADPLSGPFLQLSRADRVATAGSCFAQHIARHLAASGFNYLVTETAHPIVPQSAAREAGYGLFTARYGNIYTTLQLAQLIDRAYGRFAPAEDAWVAGDAVLDPFRPTIQPGGFASEAEMRADRAQHLKRVRQAFETLDVMVFTLGLTEGWVSRADGAAFPLCPGVAGGAFDPDRHAFRNLRVAEVREQLGHFVGRLRAVNPRARVVLTVSPVPLVATASGAHVLAATAYSKAVLRAAAQEAAEDLDEVWYFPSYEIVTGPQARGRFYAEDLREVTEEGVAHVMRVFLRHAAGVEAAAPPAAPDAGVRDETVDAAATWVGVMCDEAMLDQARPSKDEPAAAPGDERWLLVSNCQAYGLAASLSAQASHATVETHDFPRFERLLRAEPTRFAGVRRLFALQELADDPAFAEAGLPRAVGVPAMDFTPYHPDCAYIFVEGRPLTGLIGHYWSVVLLAAYKEGLGVAEACGFFDAETFSAAGFFEQWKPRCAALLDRYGKAGLDLSADLPRWIERGPFMHSPNHPKPFVLHDIARALLRRIGRTPAEAAEPVDDPLGLAAWPVYPEVAARLGVDGAYRFVPAGGAALSLEEYVADGLERLSAHPPAALGVIDFVRRHSLKPIRALMRQRLGR